MLLERLAGEVDVDRAAEIIASGAEPLRELIGAMHSKLLLRRSCARQHGGLSGGGNPTAQDAGPRDGERRRAVNHRRRGSGHRRAAASRLSRDRAPTGA